jgi:uncharacterized surface protein with fasciclin (FAS1) repeats
MNIQAYLCTSLFIFFTGLAVSQFSPGESELENCLSIAGEIGSEQYPMLAMALKAAGLDEILDEDGPFTVFIPTEEAFTTWSGLNLPALLKPRNKNELRSMLTYHIVAGRYTASKILRAMCRGGGTALFTTLQGNEILTSMEGTEIVLTDCSGNSARITLADGDRQNGVVHVIDRVIVP